MSQTIVFYSGKKCTQKINESKYTKVFDWDKDKYYLDRCASEVLCRTYMEKNNFEVITKTLKIEPDHLQDKVNKYNPQDIQSNFNKIFEEVKTYIQENCEHIKIDIEGASAFLTANLQREIADDEEKRKEFLIKLFEILTVIHKNGIVHRDIKLENLVYVRRNRKDVLVLNDWDTGFLLQNNLPDGLRNVLPIATPGYVAPEQLNSEKIGTHSDVFQAGMVAYLLYNNLRFPEQYSCIDFEEGDANRIFEDIQALFEGMEKQNRTFTVPENADKEMQKLILWTLSLKSENRPSAEIVLNKLKGVQQVTPPPILPPMNPKDCFRIIQMRRKKEEKEQQKKKLTAVLGVVVVAVVAMITTSALKTVPPKGPKNEEEPSETNIIQIEQEITETAFQPETVSISTEITEVTTVPAYEPLEDITEASASEDAEELDYTYTKWVENYRIGNGTYTGGLDDNNQMHGKDCIFVQDNGNEYYGDFYHGNRHGQGTQKTTDGVYEGDWKNNAMDGQGKYTYSNGNTYDGELKDNMRNGTGVFKLVVSSNGYQGIYNGTFSNDKFEGIGTFQFSNGDTFSGEFHEDSLWNGTVKYANGLIKTIENGKPID